MPTTQRPGLHIIPHEIKKRCIVCLETISKGELIELCPVIVLSAEDTVLIHKTKLHDYYFVWDIEEKSAALALGYGSLYNHSDEPNAEFELMIPDKMIRIYALADIPAGEEICLDYMGLKDTEASLWFQPVE